MWFFQLVSNETCWSHSGHVNFYIYITVCMVEFKHAYFLHGVLLKLPGDCPAQSDLTLVLHSAITGMVNVLGYACELPMTLSGSTLLRLTGWLNNI